MNYLIEPSPSMGEGRVGVKVRGRIHPPLSPLPSREGMVDSNDEGR